MAESTKVGSERLLELFESHEKLLKHLPSIDASLKTLVAIATKKQRQQEVNRAASDAELDSRHGDQLVRLDPRDWTGPSMKNKRMSQCPPDFLEMYAEMKDYFGSKKEADPDPEVQKKAGYERRDAVLARGWARRNKARGVTSPAATPAAQAPVDDGGWASDASAEDAGAGDDATLDENSFKW